MRKQTEPRKSYILDTQEFRKHRDLTDNRVPNEVCPEDVMDGFRDKHRTGYMNPRDFRIPLPNLGLIDKNPDRYVTRLYPEEVNKEKELFNLDDPVYETDNYLGKYELGKMKKNFNNFSSIDDYNKFIRINSRSDQFDFNTYEEEKKKFYLGDAPYLMEPNGTLSFFSKRGDKVERDAKGNVTITFDILSDKNKIYLPDDALLMNDEHCPFFLDLLQPGRETDFDSFIIPTRGHFNSVTHFIVRKVEQFLKENPGQPVGRYAAMEFLLSRRKLDKIYIPELLKEREERESDGLELRRLISALKGVTTGDYTMESFVRLLEEYNDDDSWPSDIETFVPAMKSHLLPDPVKDIARDDFEKARKKILMDQSYTDWTAYYNGMKTVAEVTEGFDYKNADKDEWRIYHKRILNMPDEKRLAFQTRLMDFQDDNDEIPNKLIFPEWDDDGIKKEPNYDYEIENQEFTPNNYDDRFRDDIDPFTDTFIKEIDKYGNVIRKPLYQKDDSVIVNKDIQQDDEPIMGTPEYMIKEMNDAIKNKYKENISVNPLYRDKDRYYFDEEVETYEDVMRTLYKKMDENKTGITRGEFTHEYTAPWEKEDSPPHFIMSADKMDTPLDEYLNDRKAKFVDYLEPNPLPPLGVNKTYRTKFAKYKKTKPEQTRVSKGAFSGDSILRENDRLLADDRALKEMQENERKMIISQIKSLNIQKLRLRHKSMTLSPYKKKSFEKLLKINQDIKRIEIEIENLRSAYNIEDKFCDVTMKDKITVKKDQLKEKFKNVKKRLGEKVSNIFTSVKEFIGNNIPTISTVLMFAAGVAGAFFRGKNTGQITG